MIRILLVLAAALVPLASVGSARAEQPLVMEGKERLFQRVLVRERTRGAPMPGAEGGDLLAPLTPLYVYERADGWLRVGRSDRAKTTAWIPEPSAVDWRQNIVVTFESTEGLDRLLFFYDLDGLYDLVEAEDPAHVARGLRAEAERAEATGTSADRIVALGPRETVDLRQNLYVMPILASEEAIFESGAFTNLLKVAVARADTATAEPVAATPAPQRREDYRAGIVLVVDTTRSMQPFIDGTRAALERILSAISASEAGDAVSFGLIGYRDTLAGAPDLGYDVRTYVPLAEDSDPAAVLAAIAGMRQASASSRHFREDSYTAIVHAIEADDMDWSPFGARFIVLVTDAGPREVGDELSQTGLSARGLATLAQERAGAAIAVMHLLTEEGKADHASAAAAYRELTSRPNLPPLYFPVEGGDEARYRAEAQRLAEIVVDQVVDFRKGAPIDSAEAAGGDAMDVAVRAAGRAMQLAYLGRIEGTRAPDVFEAYVSDRDFERTGLKPLSIRLLLNKKQLSDLDEALRLIIRKAEENVINPNEFFQQVLDAAATMSRRPEDVAARAAGASLADAANIAEYLEGLPYPSRIMAVTEDDWLRFSIAEQQMIVNELHDKVERYRRYNEATDQWVDYLGAGGGADSLVYPMLLDDLP